ncbi:hypothetical protein Cadr_000029286 [Camelus dromedarius]|uniref:Uncharacterized protein n=1 Tax=Camelus dromedarius TaxID=9838 RepID=A0A5N4C683_CAMDR|nr:hypothetical protein Cadr_000029286 [Camelus dromedarius]
MHQTARSFFQSGSPHPQHERWHRAQSQFYSGFSSSSLQTHRGTHAYTHAQTALLCLFPLSCFGHLKPRVYRDRHSSLVVASTATWWSRGRSAPSCWNPGPSPVLPALTENGRNHGVHITSHLHNALLLATLGSEAYLGKDYLPVTLEKSLKSFKHSFLTCKIEDNEHCQGPWCTSNTLSVYDTICKLLCTCVRYS